MTAAPDYGEPLVGFRVWHVVETEDGPRLHAIGRPVVWEPRMAREATCLRHRPWHLRVRRRPLPSHPAPDASCSCGVWACRAPVAALRALDGYGRPWKPVHRVMGPVSLWGTVVEHAGGWRASHAYPRALVVPRRRLHGPRVPDLDRLVDGLGAYGVPLEVVDGGTRDDLLRALTAPATALA